MGIKVHISYTPDKEGKAGRVETLLRYVLPHHKVKKSAGIPPYKHIYFTPAKAGKPDEPRGNA